MIYLDYAASSPCADSVISAMQPFLKDNFVNPHSDNVLARQAIDAIDKSRYSVANLIGAKYEEILFTSGATESNNIAIVGSCIKNMETKNNRRKIITITTEHESVLLPCINMRKLGYEIEIIPVETDGMVKLDLFSDTVDSNTLMVSIMFVNNEIGVIQPIQLISNICHKNGVLLHVDASQCIGKLHVDVDTLGIDLLSISGHKILWSQRNRCAIHKG
jgi:cysteine desulfurase